MLPGQFSFSKIAHALKSVVLAWAARNNPALTAIPDLFYPVAPSARDNHEINHVHLLRQPCRALAHRMSCGLDVR
jgi:hypothetical protein